MIPLDELLNQVSRVNIASWINTISSFHTRHTKSDSINDVANWLKQELNRLHYKNVWFHEYPHDGYQLKNVICQTLAGEDKTILICAHYDSIMEDTNNSEERAPGANDNASGMAAVLELSRILANSYLDYVVKFAFFSGEEQGLWGSNAYAKHIHQKKENMDMLINLDMVGRPPLDCNSVIIEKDEGNSVQENDRTSCHFGEIMRNMVSQYTNLRAIDGPIYDSDYMPFEALGYAVVGIYDDGQESPIHHSKSDIPTSLNLDYIVEITKVVLATLSFINKDFVF